ncbi:MAG: septal ring lytic transglycosylase RlpA family protein [Geminicoccaceae bacterium]|nr:septal ring lytic transglycosylase RlpA family protein [Geminicoccaceae bacterium]
MPLSPFRRAAWLRPVVIVLLLALAACSSTPRLPDDGGGRYKLGQPYSIKGRWYQPEFDPSYERTGIASWYGDYFHGRDTANGERFDKDLISAAHTTLPLPSLVEVTNLENGRKLVVRVNDRGPFVNDRLIDLSEAAASELGFREKGLARVRVRFLELASADGTPPRPTTGQAASPSRGTTQRAAAKPAAASPDPRNLGSTRIQTAALEPSAGGRQPQAGTLLPGDLDDLPQLSRTNDVPASGTSSATACLSSNNFVQIGAFSDRQRVDRISRGLRRLGDIRIDHVDSRSRSLFRLRVGPLDTRLRAFDVLAELRRLGYHEAYVISC